MSRVYTVLGGLLVKCDLCDCGEVPSASTKNWTTMTRGLEMKELNASGQHMLLTYKVFVLDLCGSCSTVVFDKLLDQGLIKNLSEDGGVVSEKTGLLTKPRVPFSIRYGYDIGPVSRVCTYCKMQEGHVHTFDCPAFLPAWRQPPNTNPKPVVPPPPPPAPRPVPTCVCGHTYIRHTLNGMAGRCAGTGEGHDHLCVSGCQGYIERPRPFQ